MCLISILNFKNDDDADDDEASIRKSSFLTVVLGAMAMALWGFSDSQIQAIAYWHLGTNCESASQQAIAQPLSPFHTSAPTPARTPPCVRLTDPFFVIPRLLKTTTDHW